MRLVYLFGSVARGRQTEESDADAAVLSDEGYTYEAVASLNGALSDLLRREVDLVVLNDCNPLAAKSLGRTGRLTTGPPSSTPT
ncbi:MAG: type VII toxin-antitoxin system MntA family adenylyltransferase antitoxin, partial [Bacteroidota bacterium]